MVSMQRTVLLLFLERTHNFGRHRFYLLCTEYPIFSFTHFFLSTFIKLDFVTSCSYRPTFKVLMVSFASETMMHSTEREGRQMEKRLIYYSLQCIRVSSFERSANASMWCQTTVYAVNLFNHEMIILLLRATKITSLFLHVSHPLCLLIFVLTFYIIISNCVNVYLFNFVDYKLKNR